MGKQSEAKKESFETDKMNETAAAIVEELLKRPLRVLYPDYYPMVNTECRSYISGRWCPLPGIAVEIIQLIANDLNTTIEIIPNPEGVDVNDVQNIDETEYLGFYKILHEDKADLMAYLHEPISLRQQHWDFTDPLYRSETKIVVRREDKTLQSVFDFFNVYDFYTWLFILTTFILFTVFGLIVRVVEKRFKLRPQVNGCSLVWKMVRLQIIQPAHFRYRLRAGNLSLTIFALFQCAIVMSLYQSWILTAVMRRKAPIPFYTPERLPQMLTERQYYLTTSTLNTWYYELVHLSEREPFHDIRKAVQSNPIKLVEDDDAALELVSDDSAMMVVQNDRYDFQRAKKYCNLAELPSPFYPQDETFIMRKGHPLLQSINEAIQRQIIFIHRICRKYVGYTPMNTCNENRERKPLSLTPYIGVLILWLTGLIVAFFAFFVEITFGDRSSSTEYSEEPEWEDEETFDSKSQSDGGFESGQETEMGI